MIFMFMDVHIIHFGIFVDMDIQFKEKWNDVYFLLLHFHFLLKIMKNSCLNYKQTYLEHNMFISMSMLLLLLLRWKFSFIISFKIIIRAKKKIVDNNFFFSDFLIIHHNLIQVCSIRKAYWGKLMNLSSLSFSISLKFPIQST